MDEKVLKALSLVAAELHIQNHISITLCNGHKQGYSYVSEIWIQNLANHFRDWSGGAVFSPGLVSKTSIVGS